MLLQEYFIKIFTQFFAVIWNAKRVMHHSVFILAEESKQITNCKVPLIWHISLQKVIFM